MPSMKLPSLGISLPKFKGPEVDVSVSQPNVDISVEKPEIDIRGPKIDVESPKLEGDLQAPDVDIEVKGGKVKLPKFKTPKFGFGTPDIKAPKVDLNVNPSKDDFSLEKPEGDIKVPSVDVTAGKMEGDLSVGNIDIKGPDVSLKQPEAEKPKFDVEMPKVKGMLDVDVSMPKPELDVSAPGLSMDIKPAS
ncbi:hypothetical protein chiPu_0032298, partial [Chiloscyllium punctatum]|nr:hypothetical protein [Chiloscyllium punctatum]